VAIALAPRVRLSVFRQGFKTHKLADVIARRLMEHCFAYMALGNFPSLAIVDPHGEPGAHNYELLAMFRAAGVVSPARPIKVRDVPLEVFDVMRPFSKDAKHELHLCAHRRVVETRPFRGIPHLDKPPLTTDTGERFVYSAFVSGPSLDRTVTSTRLAFNLPAEPDPLRLPGQLDDQSLMDALAEDTRERLGAFLARIGDERTAAVRAYTTNDAPQFRHLLARKPDAIRELPPTKDKKELDRQLYRLAQEHEAEVRDRLEEIEQKIEASGENDEEDLEESLRNYMQQVTELNHAELAAYVAKRRFVIKMLEKCMQVSVADVIRSRSAITLPSGI
jgi:hypothetical protein